MTDQIKVQYVPMPHSCVTCKYCWGGFCQYWKLTNGQLIAKVMPLNSTRMAEGMANVICQKWEAQ